MSFKYNTCTSLKTCLDEAVPVHLLDDELSNVLVVVIFGVLTIHTIATLIFTRNEYTKKKPTKLVYAKIQRCEQQQGTSETEMKVKCRQLK